MPERTLTGEPYRATSSRGIRVAQASGQVAGRPPAGSVRVAQAADVSPTEIDVTVTWSSPFGSRVSGTVSLYGQWPPDRSWTRIATRDVSDTNTATFQASPRYAMYRAVIQPSDDVRGDAQDIGQFTKTELLTRLPARATSITISGGLELNRWNPVNVRQRHAAMGFDPDRTSERENTQQVRLFGRPVRVHRLLVPRVEDTNRRYEALPPDVKLRIAASLYVTGGYAYRNVEGKTGAFSDHSVGTAIDVNPNAARMQNIRFNSAAELALLNELVQPVVRLDPTFREFNIWQARGQEQLRASHAFVEQFPLRLMQLLGRHLDVARINALIREAQGAELGFITNKTVAEARDNLAKGVKEAFAPVTTSMLKAAADTARDPVNKRQLELIYGNWKSLNAWVVGAPVVDKHAGERGVRPERKVAYGMIPLDPAVLQLFLDSGWEWGGDWTAQVVKDYMHFQDEGILRALAARP